MHWVWSPAWARWISGWQAANPAGLRQGQSVLKGTDYCRVGRALLEDEAAWLAFFHLAGLGWKAVEGD
ncbi:MAG: hypothetical protein ACOX20_08100 [Limnochordia bacterium]|nr:hypothetical protein [Bacillota bacterium]